MRTMAAKYPGHCPACNNPIRRGELINFFGKGHAEHTHCQKADKGPDAPCWVCKSPNGYFRNMGAATPVWCDACFAAEKAKTQGVCNVRFQKFEPDRFDMQVEDNMRDACGL